MIPTTFTCIGGMEGASERERDAQMHHDDETTLLSVEKMWRGRREISTRYYY